jgi:hypothetical protein
MFKKKIATLVAAALMTLSASSAFAAFGELELIRVYYDRATGAEIVTDLGNINTLLSSSGAQTFAGSTTGLTGSSIYAAYFAISKTAPGQVWVSGNATTATTSNGTITTLGSGATSLFAAWGTTNTSYQNLVGVATSFRGKLSNANNTVAGTLSNFVSNTSRLNTESLFVASQAATQGLWYFATATTAAGPNRTGVLAATITTDATGNTTFTSNQAATATPIPAAIYLMGSGLLGLVGLRRRNKA